MTKEQRSSFISLLFYLLNLVHRIFEVYFAFCFGAFYK